MCEYTTSFSMTIRNYKEYLRSNIEIVSSGCWIWTKSLNFDGYGQARYRRKNIAAHRLSYIIYKGDIPEGLLVCHDCDNPACVNPTHLEIGTQKKNMRDCLARGRYRGAAQKLRPQDYAEIARIYNNSLQFIPAREVGEMFNISAGYVRSIAAGRVKPVSVELIKQNYKP